MPTRSCPMPPGHIVDQVGESLWHRSFGVSKNKECSSTAVRPVSRARRIDASLMRYTMAAPADSTLATAPNCSARSRSSGPGTTTVKSACSRKWRSAAQHLVHRLDDILGCGACQQRADRGGDRSAARDADHVRLRQQRAYRVRLQPDCPAGPSPDHRPRRLGRIDAGARRKAGEEVSSSSRRSSGAAVEYSESDSAA